MSEHVYYYRNRPPGIGCQRPVASTSTLGNTGAPGVE